jgi:exonuclease SbcD
MKFIVTGDWHFRGTNPRARMDDFQEALTHKIYEVFNLAQEHEAEAIVVPGDVFDSPGTALGTIADLAYLLQQAPCKILAVHGNHDIWGSNPGSKYRTPFGLLAKLELLWDLEQEPYETGWVSPDLLITGHGYNTETDTELGMAQFSPAALPEGFEGVSIRVVHSMLMQKPPGFDMRHTLIRDVRTTAKVVISGHEHLGFGIKRREDGVLFINPGALCRLSANPAEMERQVQVAVLEVENGEAEAFLVPLKSARPGYEVLSRDHLEQEAEREERINRFLGLLAAEGEAKFLEIQEIVDDIARREELPAAVVKEALDRIGRAREALSKAG